MALGIGTGPSPVTGAVLQATRVKLEEKEREAEELQQRIEQLESEKAGLERRLGQVMEQIDVLVRDKDENREADRARLEGLQESLEDLQTERDMLKAELAETEQLLAKARAALSEAQSRIRELEHYDELHRKDRKLKRQFSIFSDLDEHSYDADTSRGRRRKQRDMSRPTTSGGISADGQPRRRNLEGELDRAVDMWADNGTDDGSWQDTREAERRPGEPGRVELDLRQQLHEATVREARNHLASAEMNRKYTTYVAASQLREAQLARDKDYFERRLQEALDAARRTDEQRHHQEPKEQTAVGEEGTTTTENTGEEREVLSRTTTAASHETASSPSVYTRILRLRQQQSVIAKLLLGFYTTVATLLIVANYRERNLWLSANPAVARAYVVDLNNNYGKPPGAGSWLLAGIMDPRLLLEPLLGDLVERFGGG